jgi:hypothetical protein
VALLEGDLRSAQVHIDRALEINPLSDAATRFRERLDDFRTGRAGAGLTVREGDWLKWRAADASEPTPD